MTAHHEPFLTRDDLRRMPREEPDRRFRYGDHPEQAVDLYLPARPGGSDAPAPVALLLHGGCWRSTFGREYLSGFARALGEHGIASWNVEYRRLGTGGGWPSTFKDVATAADLLHEVADEERLDATRVVAVGHSAGGHLGLWLDARASLPPDAPGASSAPLELRGVVTLAGMPDLTAAYAHRICGTAVEELLGGNPAEVGSVTALASPLELPPTSRPHVHLVGEHDAIVPPAYVRDCAERATARGQDTRFKILPAAGHFEPVVAGAGPWPDVLGEVQRLLDG